MLNKKKRCKELYCSNCRRHCVHEYYGSNNDLPIPFRVFAGVITLGASEMASRYDYWKCIKCAEIREG